MSEIVMEPMTMKPSLTLKVFEPITKEEVAQKRQELLEMYQNGKPGLVLMANPGAVEE